jgi:hypothetical protein
VTDAMIKYPRTRHILGSRLQPGDHDLAALPLSELAGHHLVVEEKLDGANAAISFAPSGELRLQSRGHFLTGGPRERHFALLKTWASARQPALWDLLGDRYIVYGEWLYAKHTIFYDQLPHYFLEFDVLDRRAGEFLATERRRQLLAGSAIASVPVLWTGTTPSLAALEGLIGPSAFKSPRWKDRLAEVAAATARADRAGLETDPSDLMEGLYIKVEEGGLVTGRYKYVRASFLAAVVGSGSHWLDRPIVPNQLAAGVELFTGSS